jgi:hypothetical protein
MRRPGTPATHSRLLKFQSYLNGLNHDQNCHPVYSRPALVFVMGTLTKNARLFAPESCMQNASNKRADRRAPPAGFG